MNACAPTCKYSHTLCPAHSLTCLSLMSHMNAWMHTCTPVHPCCHLDQSCPQLHTCTPICVHPPCLVPTLPCPTYTLVMHISPTSLPMPSPHPTHAITHTYTSPLPYVWTHAFPQCIHHHPHVPPPSPSSLWLPSSHMYVITHKYAPSPSCPHPTQPAYIFSLVPHTCTHHLALWYVFFMFYFILLTILFVYTI